MVRPWGASAPMPWRCSLKTAGASTPPQRPPPPTALPGLVHRAGGPGVCRAPRGVGNLELVISPDPSRAVVDAWDDLRVLGLWAVALLGALFALVRWALGRTMRVTAGAQVMDALDCTGGGRSTFACRSFRCASWAACRWPSTAWQTAWRKLWGQRAPESEREVACPVQARLEDERRAIARELHDTLAQCITGVRALAGAIAQRTSDQPALQQPAQTIVAVTGEMQDGVKAILVPPAFGAGT